MHKPKNKDRVVCYDYLKLSVTWYDFDEKEFMQFRLWSANELEEDGDTGPTELPWPSDFKLEDVHGLSLDDI